MNPIRNTSTVSAQNAALHDAVRPAWSVEVVSWLLGSPLAGSQLSVLDLGAGTGLGTRTIANLGHTVTAVDTSKSMLSVLQEGCEELPSDVAARITTAIGSAESLPLESQSVDAITCFQAWHWVNREQAIAECDRVLTATGIMSLAWHTWDRSNTWVKELAAIVEPKGIPADQTQTVPSEFAGRGPFERKNFPFTYEISVGQLVHLASSWAFVAERTDQRVVLAKIRRLGEQAKSPDTGLVCFPHITAAFRLQKPDRGSRR